MATAVGAVKCARLGSGVSPRATAAGFRLPVFVIFTSMNRTLKAMEKARALAYARKAPVEILMVAAVPFTLPLDMPPAPLEFIARHLGEMADGFPERPRVSAYLCRDELEALKGIMDRNCPVVMGVRKTWWPTRDERIARRLRRAGFTVHLVEIQ